MTAMGLKEAVSRKGSFFGTLKAVAWSFFGVRKSADYQRDVEQLNPVHLIIAGIALAALFVAVLVLIVTFVIGSGIAT
jgi:hypothetical protein